MSTRKLLTNGNAFKRTDNRWGGVVWYMDEQGERKRKSFSGTTKAEVNKKMTEYIAAFNDSIIESQETKKRLRDSMQNWLEVFKFPSVERTTYDRYECTAKNQIYPYIGDKVVGDVKSADIKKLLNDKMNEGYAYTTVKKVHNVLNEYFRYLTQQKYIDRNPMISAPMIKKSNFLAAQDKENLPTNETITVFTLEEIKIFKDEAFSTFSNGKRKYQQVAAYILMLNTGLRTGDDDDKIRLNQRKPSKYKGLRRFGPEKNLQRINKFMKERPIFYKKLIQMKENFRFYLRCFYCITKVVILQFNSENRTELARNG